MLLDLKDPTRVLARTISPILEPLASYENDGFKSGVVYPCGAVVIKERLFVYYGGADTFVCVASAKLEPFLRELITNHKEPKLASIPVQAQNDKNMMDHFDAQCRKCGRMREIKNPRLVVLKNMKQVIHGICPVCGGKMSKTLKPKSEIDEETSHNREKTKKKKNAKHLNN
jgi:hypothetical protein